MKLFLAKNLDEMREMCVKRSEELDDNLSYAPSRPITIPQMQSITAEPIVAQQSPSMQRLMAQNPDLIPKPPVPATPQAAEALQKRQKLISDRMNGTDTEGKRGSPRKF